MSAMSPEFLDITEIVEDLEDPIPCDYNERSWWRGREISHSDGKWVLHWRCPDCSKGLPRIVCSPCKDLMTSTPDGVSCPFCNAPIVPAKDGISRIEAL